MTGFEAGDRVKYSAEWLESSNSAVLKDRYSRRSGTIMTSRETGSIVKWDGLKSPTFLFHKWLTLDDSDPDCRVCYGPCQQDIHAATVRIHKWFREFVTLSLDKTVVRGKLHVPGVGPAAEGA